MGAIEVIRFRATGEPVPQGSKKLLLPPGKQPVMVEDAGVRHASWRREVTAAATEARLKAGIREPLTGAMSVLLTFCFFRRQYDYGTGRNIQIVKAGAAPYPIKPPDIDKLTRAVFDAITDARIWVDDSQVVAATLRKIWIDKYGDEPEGVAVVIGVIE